MELFTLQNIFQFVVNLIGSFRWNSNFVARIDKMLSIILISILLFLLELLDRLLMELWFIQVFKECLLTVIETKQGTSLPNCNISCMIMSYLETWVLLTLYNHDDQV